MMRTLQIENLSRRVFLRQGLAIGAGLTLGLRLLEAAEPMRAGPGLAGGDEATPGIFSPNAFVRIGSDDTVTVIVKHLEMGQGTYTGLPTLVAEELDASWDQVRAEGAPADAKRYNNLFWGPAHGTGDSTAIANSFEQMRKAGAAARAMLVQAAAGRWQVPAAEISIQDGVLSHPSGQQARFGELAEAAAALPVPDEVQLKDPSAFRLIGNPTLRRKDGRDKIDGSARFTQDVQLPETLVALVCHPPRFGAKVRSYDPTPALVIDGVEQVRIDMLYAGGSFGRRANPQSDYVVEAARIFKAAGGKVPVKLQWLREDDMRAGWYRPMYLHRLRAGLDADGRPVAWEHRIVGQSIIAGTAFEPMLVVDEVDQTSVEGAKDLPYAIPNLVNDLHSPTLGVPVQWWRSVGSTHTAFAVECMIDALAEAAGADPVDFRLKLLAEHPRHQGGADAGRREGGLGRAPRRGPSPRRRRARVLQQLCRPGGRGDGTRQRVQCRPRRHCRGLRHRRQPGCDPGADGRRDGVRPVRGPGQRQFWEPSPCGASNGYEVRAQ